METESETGDVRRAPALHHDSSCEKQPADAQTRMLGAREGAHWQRISRVRIVTLTTELKL